MESSDSDLHVERGYYSIRSFSFNYLSTDLKMDTINKSL